MNEWLITNKPVSFKNKFERAIKLVAGYSLYFSLSAENSFYDENKNSGIFIFGYYVSKLNINIDYTNLHSLFFELSRNPNKTHEIIKGIYTIVLIQKGCFYIINDPFGLSKYYYSFDKEYAIFSGRMKYVKQIGDASISKTQLLAYYVFNYSLNGNTFFNKIKYSIPGSISFIGKNGSIKSGQYFDILAYMSRESYKLDKQSLY